MKKPIVETSNEDQQCSTRIHRNAVNKTLETFTFPNDLLTMKEINYNHPLSGKTIDSCGNVTILRIEDSVSGKNNNILLDSQDKPI